VGVARCGTHIIQPAFGCSRCALRVCIPCSSQCQILSEGDVCQDCHAGNRHQHIGNHVSCWNSLCWSHWLWWSASLLVESAVCLKLLNSSSLCVLLTVCPRFSVCSTWWIVRSSRPSAVQVKFALCYSIEYVCYIVYTFKC